MQVATIGLDLAKHVRDRRSGKPVKCHARKERALLVGTRSANHIRAGGHSGCTQGRIHGCTRNVSRKRQIPLASRAPSIHGTSETNDDDARRSAYRGQSGHRVDIAQRPTLTQTRHAPTGLRGLQPIIVAKRSISSSGILNFDGSSGSQFINFGEESS
jgi:hypothetical protein